jgi:V/A-type H+-transporting ATPase subunit E
MSLETVVEDIRKEALKSAKRILSEASKVEEGIVDSAKKSAAGVKMEGKEEVDRIIRLEREQRFSSANLEAKQKVLEMKRDLIEIIRNDVEEEIKSISGKEREALTKILIDSSAKEFENVDDIVVYGQSKDEKLLKSLLKNHKGIKYGGMYDCIGGVVMESESARMRVNNTFDSIIDSVWTEELKNISELLFGSNQ